jgi:hypothetical protein
MPHISPVETICEAENVLNQVIPTFRMTDKQIALKILAMPITKHYTTD